jgi:predicted O-linked N-acetylglucosamine transferase (SPINDLY family)
MFDRRFPPESAPAIDSEPEDTALEQALHLHRQGQLAEAEARYRAILDRNPEHFDALQLLGALAAQQGQWSVALGYLDRALLIRQDQAETHYNRGIVLQNLEQPEAAIDSYRQTLALDDGHLNARNNLGLMLQSLERLDEARQAYEQVLELQPDFAEVHCNLGNVFKDMQQLPEALRCYEQAIRLKPDYALAYYNKGNLLSELQQPQEALGCYAQAIRLKPDYAVAYFNQGNTLKNLGDCGAALSSYDQALQFKPDYAEAHYNSGNVLRELHRFGDGLAHYQQALTVRSDFADVYVNRSNTYKDLGYLVEAETGYRQALSLSPGNPHYHSNLLFLLGYCPERQTPAAYLKEARCWETMVLTDIQRRAAHEFGFKQVSRSQRPLRIGILSAELGRHAVAYFLVPWLSKRDRNRISLFLYPTRQCTDEYAASFEAMADAWCPVDELEDEAAVQRIRADQIDILIETSGHTAGNRLGIIARRAAPIQCHYIGYFASTGLSTMDYLLADDVLIPPALETQFTETIWRLPRSWLAYQPLEQAPEPGWLPAEDGRICLGSFNNLVKVREDCLRLWAGVLKALPEAWLLLKDGRATDPASQRRIREALQALGVDEQRVVFAGRMKDWAEHMRLYDQVDIALDTLPMNSGTTAFDALWMGVPLITLAGSTLAGRMGAAIVTGIGHPEWVVVDEADYVTKVVALARDVDIRKRLRHTQREQMRNSPLCDGEGLARSLEAAFEAMFDRRWSAAHTT